MSELFLTLFYLSITSALVCSNSTQVNCPVVKGEHELDIKLLVGNWITVYSQPKAISCFSMTIRATSEVERETCALKYGKFDGRVDWDQCLLELGSPLGKHYLQGVGQGGVLENVIIATNSQDEYYLVEQRADQWSVYGQRGSELLLMRDCFGEAAAVFARTTVWPASTDLYAVLHRSGIAPLSEGVLCSPETENTSQQHCSITKYISN